MLVGVAVHTISSKHFYSQTIPAMLVMLQLTMPLLNVAGQVPNFISLGVIFTPL